MKSQTKERIVDAAVSIIFRSVICWGFYPWIGLRGAIGLFVALAFLVPQKSKKI